MDRERPKSVSVISWILIVWGILLLINVSRMPAIFNNPEYQELAELTGESLGVSMAITGFLSILYLVSGIAMLKGCNWGRHLYLWGNGIIILLSNISYGFSLRNLPSIIIFTVLFFFLTRPAASEFFKWSPEE